MAIHHNSRQRSSWPCCTSYRVIQIGSFGSAEAAQNAWLGLQARYPGVEQYHPVYQKITTASGKSMVRLKVGPVASEDQP